MNHLQPDNISKVSMIQRAPRYNVTVPFDKIQAVDWIWSVVNISNGNAKSVCLFLLLEWEKNLTLKELLEENSMILMNIHYLQMFH